MKRFVILIVLAILAAPVWLLAAPTSKPIHYQARVTDPDGQAITGPATVTFSVYGTLSGLTALWSETHNLTANAGYVEADLGSVTPFPAGLFDRPQLFLGVRVGTDPEMLPRKRLAGAWRARSAERIGGRTLQSDRQALTVNNAIETTVAVVFPQAFNEPPVVTAGPLDNPVGAEYFMPVAVSEVTVTGCVIHFRSVSGQPATGTASFDWIAIGK